MSTLEGRVAVVTGAGAGIGLAVAEALAAQGAQLVLCDIDPAAAAVASRLGATFVAADTRVEIELEQVFAVAEELHGGVDLLVNNAGGASRPLPGRAGDELDRRAGPQPARADARDAARDRVDAPARRRRDRQRRLVRRVGLGPHPMPDYAAAKAGLMRLTGALAPLAAEGIRVSCICPGMVDTPARAAGASA